MKDGDFTRPAVVLTVDQRHSRRSADRVPALLDALSTTADGVLLPAERTAGDEVQLLVADPVAAVDLCALVLRDEQWWLGVGLGGVELPLPNSTRAARGTAYLAAREAVDQAHHSPAGLAVRSAQPPAPAGNVSGSPYGGDMSPLCHEAETSLLLLAQLYRSRSPQGWEVADLLSAGESVASAARTLGVSPSAVSQRHRRAGWELEGRTRQLAAAALTRALAEVAA